jgi:SAM-dependent methyltransferase
LDVLGFQPDDRRVGVLCYGLGSQLQYEAERCGNLALEYFSVPYGASGQALLDALLDFEDDPPGDGIRTRRRIASVLADWDGSGPGLRKIAAVGPWNFDRPEGLPADAIRYFHLLNRRQSGRWEFLPLGDLSGWQRCYEQSYLPYITTVEQFLARHPVFSELGDQMMPSGESALSGLLLQRFRLRQQGFRLLTRNEFEAWSDAPSGWDTPEVAMTQHRAFAGVFEQYRSGNKRADLMALEKILRRIVRPGASILEEGCGSGYNFAFIRDTVRSDVSYVGIDIARAMIALARQSGYPGCSFAVMAAEALEFPAAAFDIVLNGASLMHTVKFEKAVAEARRVARDYVLLHTVTVTEDTDTIYFEKNAYGSRVPEVVFSSRFLVELLGRNNLLPVFMERSIDYDLHPVVGVSTRSISLACLCLDRPNLPDIAPERCNHYCTYFDAHYLPRGVAMIRSLIRHDPLARVFVLCFDAATESYIQTMAPNVTAVGVDELCAADPEFAESRHNRSRIEWYFTSTAAFPHYLLRRFPALPRITYLDADLYFYCSPEPLHFEARDASVQIIEHRFSPHLAPLEVYGRFNVAWISFFNTPEGNRVIDDYRSECIQWCYDRIEGDRFADQKYLDRWPERYPRCCVSQLLGANVAMWNLDRWRIDRLGEELFVNGERLVFYHFHGIKRLDSGGYSVEVKPNSFGEYFGRLYASYLALLQETERELEPVLKNAERCEIRYARPTS